MKKIWAILLTAALVTGLAGCGHFVSIMPGTEISAAGQEPDGENANGVPGQADTDPDGFSDRPLYSFIGWDSFGSTYYDNTPIALSLQRDGAYMSPLFDRASIIAACDALRNMTVTGRTEEAPGGQETVFTFTMSNGDERSITFYDGLLILSTGAYTVEGGEALWDIRFPCYDSGFDMFDLYSNQGIRDFADGFYDSTPVSVGRRINNGATLTSQREDTVEEVFSLLRRATLNRIEANPDQTIDLTSSTDYIFTMSDASYYTFTFVGPCLAVTVSGAYGPVYYWLDGIDELDAITILPESTLPVFEGGRVTGLREEIARAADVANGESDSDVTVVGVYVNYVIDGQRGYLTLDGDTANDFVRQVTAITATDELAEGELTGDEIQVYVTLSDMTGPILYFTGDTVQQMYGTNYVCNSGDMSDLRARILELAKDEKNVAYITETTTG